jgi:hypothetical protein
MNSILFSCRVSTSDAFAELGLEAWINNIKFFDSAHIDQSQIITVDLSDNEGNHELRFVMTGKTIEHTKIDEQGNIVKDATLHLSNITFDNIDITQLFQDQSVYTHDFNGTKPETQNKFYGTAGCNGTISFKFTTPIYLWLLENM